MVINQGPDVPPLEGSSVFRSVRTTFSSTFLNTLWDTTLLFLIIIIMYGYHPPFFDHHLLIEHDVRIPPSIFDQHLLIKRNACILVWLNIISIDDSMPLITTHSYKLMNMLQLPIQVHQRVSN
jgi:hypothetical protein